jgi:hypothetical protein
MGKLTRRTPPENIIRYVTTAERYDLVQKLGAIEHQAEDLITRVCDNCCRHPYEIQDQTEMDDKCAGCAMTRLAELIGI